MTRNSGLMGFIRETNGDCLGGTLMGASHNTDNDTGFVSINTAQAGQTFLGVLEHPASAGDVVGIRTFLDGTLSVRVHSDSVPIVRGQELSVKEGRACTLFTSNYPCLVALEPADVAEQLIEVAVSSPINVSNL